MQPPSNPAAAAFVKDSGHVREMLPDVGTDSFRFFHPCEYQLLRLLSCRLFVSFVLLILVQLVHA